MSMFVTIGRILFALLFIVSGGLQLFDIASTAQEISAKVIIPSMLQPYATQIENAVAMSMPQLLAVGTGTLEVVCGLMIAFNLGVRFFSFLLILFVIAVTFYLHDFWNQAGQEARDNVAHALKNVALLGALLMLFGYGSGRTPIDNEPYQEH
jgi:uncharacterized membrane protein YphA (DoxX/SURF4 family)